VSHTAVASSHPSVLFTFLGRTAKDKSGGYPKTSYLYAGKQLPKLAFVGWTLAEQLAVDRVVVLGTSGSMWEHLLEVDIELGNQFEDQRVALIDAVERKAVDTAMLRPLEALLSDSKGYRVELQIVPYANTPAEQIALVAQIADNVASGELAHLDVTHGFRHLPMVALLALLQLRIVKRIKPGKVLYGAFDPDNGAGHIHDLGGLLHIGDWFAALSTHQKDGDYGVFAPLLQADGLPDKAADELKRAAFYERTLDSDQARRHLRTVRQPLRDLNAGLSVLFRDRLLEEFAWVDSPQDHQRQFRQARRCVEVGDYLRAIVLAFEASISKACYALGKNPGQPDARKYALERMQALNPEPEPFRDLRKKRNALAHGERDAKLFRDDDDARKQLFKLIDKVEKFDLPRVL